MRGSVSSQELALCRQPQRGRNQCADVSLDRNEGQRHGALGLPQPSLRAPPGAKSTEAVAAMLPHHLKMNDLKGEGAIRSYAGRLPRACWGCSPCPASVHFMPGFLAHAQQPIREKRPHSADRSASSATHSTCSGVWSPSVNSSVRKRSACWAVSSTGTPWSATPPSPVTCAWSGLED